MKKVNKGYEGQSKARESTVPKFHNFPMSMGLFGVNNPHVSLFLTFKDKKFNKAALVAKNTKLQTRKLLSSKILSYHLVMCTFCPNFNPTFQIGGFKGQNVPQRPQN